MNTATNYRIINGKRDDKFDIIEHREKNNKKILRERYRKVSKILKRLNYVANGILVLAVVEFIGSVDTFSYTSGLNGIKTFAIGLAATIILAWIGLSIKVIIAHLKEE